MNVKTDSSIIQSYWQNESAFKLFKCFCSIDCFQQCCRLNVRIQRTDGETNRKSHYYNYNIFIFLDILAKIIIIFQKQIYKKKKINIYIIHP